MGELTFWFQTSFKCRRSVYGMIQRVLNYLQRARLSRQCLIWLLPPPPLPSVSSIGGGTQEDWKTEKGEGGGGGGGSLVLYKSFNTLFEKVSISQITTTFIEADQAHRQPVAFITAFLWAARHQSEVQVKVMRKLAVHCKNNVIDFPVPSRDVNNQTLPGRE